MQTVIRFVKIERKQFQNGWMLVGTLANGKTTWLGSAVMTEAGSKSMLTRRAKQFGLKVAGNTAA